ncbi:MAG TPA: LysR family transcriptional regulator [Pseudogracilibacillus sp.]|nr:LysR family transcriptional regulator [Pseudogracilibacillus sp.]
MELQQLKYFKMLCHYRNFTRTAQEFNISQPSITVSIKKLEEELGVKLLERNKKYVKITPVGEVFLERVIDILKQVEDTSTEISDYKLNKKETIRIGIPPMIGSYLLPHLFDDFIVKYPHIHLDVKELGTVDIQKALTNDELDIALVIITDSYKDHHTYYIKDEEICLVSSKASKYHKDIYIDFKDLKNETFILMNEGAVIRDIIIQECHNYSFEPHIIHSSTQIETVRKLVSLNIGVTFMPNVFAAQLSNLNFTSFKNAIYIKTGLSWTEDKYLSRACQLLINYIKNI